MLGVDLDGGWWMVRTASSSLVEGTLWTLGRFRKESKWSRLPWSWSSWLRSPWLRLPRPRSPWSRSSGPCSSGYGWWEQHHYRWWKATDLGEILKILVNIEAEYWNRIWIDFENRYFGQSGTDGVSRNIFIGIYSYVFRTFEGGVSHKKPAVSG